MILKKPSRFLLSALIVSCGMMAMPQPSQAHETAAPEEAQDQLMMKSSDFTRNNTLASKSVTGQDVRFFLEGNDITFDGKPNEPRSTAVVLDMKDAGCIVNINFESEIRIGDNLIAQGVRDDLALVNPDLSRISNGNHEIGHCVDFTVMPKIMAQMAGTGVNSKSVVNLGLVSALKGSGQVDFNDIAAKGASWVLAERDSADAASMYTTATQEAYADLQAVYQTAALTGSYDSFTGIINNYRQVVKWDMNHSDNLAVYRVLQAEAAAGVKPGDFIGQSHEQISDHVNDVFQKHFYENGQFSVKSEGFKSIVAELHIRAQLNPALEAAQRDMIGQFDKFVTPAELKGSAMEFMALSNYSIRNQMHDMQEKTIEVPLESVHAQVIMAKQISNHLASMEILGISKASLDAYIQGDSAMKNIFSEHGNALSAQRDSLYHSTSIASIVRRATTVGGDYRLSPEATLTRASFKNALTKLERGVQNKGSDMQPL